MLPFFAHSFRFLKKGSLFISGMITAIVLLVCIRLLFPHALAEQKTFTIIEGTVTVGSSPTSSALMGYIESENGRYYPNDITDPAFRKKRITSRCPEGNIYCYEFRKLRIYGFLTTNTEPVMVMGASKPEYIPEIEVIGFDPLDISQPIE